MVENSYEEVYGAKALHVSLESRFYVVQISFLFDSCCFTETSIQGFVQTVKALIPSFVN